MPLGKPGAGARVDGGDVPSIPSFTGPRIEGLEDFLAHQARIEEDDAVALGHPAALQTLFAGTGDGGLGPRHAGEASRP